MRIVVAVESWPGVDGTAALTPQAAASVVEQEWRASAPHVTVEAFPVPVAGPRMADAVAGPRSRAGGTEVVEGPAGLWLAPANGASRWNPQDLSTALLGLAAAGEKRIVHVPLGDEPPAGDAVDLWGGNAQAVRKALASLAVLALPGVNRPLLGFHGMSSAVRDGREHDPAIAAASQEQERRWTAIALEGDAVGATGALLGPSRLSDSPGTGAAGGLAYCLAVLGVRLAPASTYVVEAWGIREASESADLLAAITGDLTPRALDYGIASAMAAQAGLRAVPAVVLSPSVQVGKRDLMAAGVASAHEAAVGEPGLSDGVRRLAQTWTPQK